MAGPDKTLGKYLLKSRLGHGGMGIVYLATDTRLHRDVAIKILPRQLASDKDAVKRFQHEARVVARLNHPNVVVVHDVDQDKGYCYLVMELLTGGTMADAIQAGSLPWKDATAVIVQTCRGLAAAHEVGLVHRDIKPSNIMRAANGIVKLTDFGLAKIVDDSAGAIPLTRSGAILGTPHFMSPEQCRGEPLDGRSDLYSLGATYFTLLIGRPPFADAEPLQVMFAHCSRPAPNPCQDRTDIPEMCGQILQKAMAKNRADRFATAKEMLKALEDSIAITPSDVATSSFSNAVMEAKRGLASLPTEDVSARAVPIAETSVLAATVVRLRQRITILALAAVVAMLLLMTVLVAWNPFRNGAAHERTVIESNGRLGLSLHSEFPVGHTKIRSIVFSPEGRSLFSGGIDGPVEEWDVVHNKVVRTFADTKQGILAVATNPDWLAAGGHAKTVWLWKRETVKPHATLSEFGGSVSALAFSPDGRRLAVGAYSEVRLYEMNDSGAKSIKTLGTSGSDPICYMVMSAAFSSDGRWLATTTWNRKRVFVWNAVDGTLHKTSPDLPENPMSVAFVGQSNRLAIGMQTRGMVLWNVDQPAVEPVVGLGQTPVRALSVTPDGQTVFAIGEWGGAIRILDLRQDREVRMIPRATGASAVAIALSSDGKRLATGGGDESGERGYLHLFDVVREKAE